jgi:hypothetical protein
LQEQVLPLMAAWHASALLMSQSWMHSACIKPAAAAAAAAAATESRTNDDAAELNVILHVCDGLWAGIVRLEACWEHCLLQGLCEAE